MFTLVYTFDAKLIQLAAGCSPIVMFLLLDVQLDWGNKDTSNLET